MLQVQRPGADQRGLVGRGVRSGVGDTQFQAVPGVGVDRRGEGLAQVDRVAVGVPTAGPAATEQEPAEAVEVLGGVGPIAAVADIAVAPGHQVQQGRAQGSLPRLGAGAAGGRLVEEPGDTGGDQERPDCCGGGVDRLGQRLGQGTPGAGAGGVREQGAADQVRGRCVLLGRDRQVRGPGDQVAGHDGGGQLDEHLQHIAQLIEGADGFAVREQLVQHPDLVGNGGRPVVDDPLVRGGLVPLRGQGLRGLRHPGVLIRPLFERVIRGRQLGDFGAQALAVAQGRHAHLFQLGVGEGAQGGAVDVVVPKRLGVLAEFEPFQPVSHLLQRHGRQSGSREVAGGL